MTMETLYYAQDPAKATFDGFVDFCINGKKIPGDGYERDQYGREKRGVIFWIVANDLCDGAQFFSNYPASAGTATLFVVVIQESNLLWTDIPGFTDFILPAGTPIPVPGSPKLHTVDVMDEALGDACSVYNSLPEDVQEKLKPVMFGTTPMISNAILDGFDPEIRKLVDRLFVVRPFKK